MEESSSINTTKERPTSRRGHKNQQEIYTRLESKQGAMTTESRNVFSRQGSTASARPPTSIVQGTASRIATAISQRPTTSRAIATPIIPSLHQVSTTDRLVTQQGLSRAGSAFKRTNTRQIQDKRYYEGLLQVKIRELATEIERIQSETEKTKQEQSAHVIYDKRVKKLATELTDLQRKLGDYNIMMDKINTATSLSDIKTETENMKKENDEMQKTVDELIGQRVEKQNKLEDLENALSKEKNKTEQFVTSMTQEMQQKYIALQRSNENLQQTVDKLQQQFESLTKECQQLERHISTSSSKTEALKLHQKLLQLQEKKDELTQEIDDKSNSRRKDTILSQMKKDKDEMAAMEGLMNQLKTEIERIEKKSSQVQSDIEECKGGRHQKYLELRKKEEIIEHFLSTFEENRKMQLGKLEELKDKILKLLQRLSKHLLTLPLSNYEYDLLNIEVPTTVDETTNRNSLLIQYQQRKLYFEKLVSMEAKLKAEINGLNEKSSKMRSELKIYEDLDALRREKEEKRSKLLSNKQSLLQLNETVSAALENTKLKYNEIQKQLEENEVYVQISMLQRKLAQQQQNNFEIEQFIENKKCETDYSKVKKDALQLVTGFNHRLKANASSYTYTT